MVRMKLGASIDEVKVDVGVKEGEHASRDEFEG
jgi:ribosomal protein L19